MSLRVGFIIAPVVIAAAVGLYWQGRQDGAAREQPKTEAALAQAAVSNLETTGARGNAHRVEVTVHQQDAAKAVVTQLASEAKEAEDANAPLDPDRAARLRRADQQLCLADPELACTADRDAG